MTMDETSEEEEEILEDRLIALRNYFTSTYAESIEDGSYDSEEVSWMCEDRFLRQYLRHQAGHLDRAAAMMDSTMKWRKGIHLNKLTENSFPLWVHEVGISYYHNHDKNGHKILIFEIQKHKKNAAHLHMAKQFVAWKIDQHFRRFPSQQVVVIYDMSQAGISNIDLELIKFQIQCFTSYFPCYLAYILVYDMPWILNAIWRVIRGLLSAQQQKLVLFVSGDQIQKHIDVDHLLVRMGGNDTYEYKYVPTTTSMPEKPEVNWSSNAALSDEDDVPTSVIDTDIPPPSPQPEKEKKKHHSSSHQQEGGAEQRHKPHKTRSSSKTRAASKNKSKTRKGVGPGESGTTLGSQDTVDTKSTGGSRHHSADRLRHRKTLGGTHDGKLLRVSPSHEVVFNTEKDEDAYEVLNLMNSQDKRMAFKVKTTSPDSYRVRPTTGTLKPGETADISIYLKRGHSGGVDKDKFLVMGMTIPDKMTSDTEIEEYWKKASRNPEDYQEHRLWCATSDKGGGGGGGKKDEISKMDEKQNELIEEMLAKQKRLERRIYQLFSFQLILALILICLGIALLLTYTLGYLPGAATDAEACSPVFWH